MIIYKAENKINGKIYIGQTIRSLDERKKQHIRDALSDKYNMCFHSAIRKYGKNEFKWEILCCCDSKEGLDDMEFHYIKQYSSFLPNGYNMTLSGSGSFGYKWSAERREKWSKSQTGKGNNFYGHKHSKRHINAITGNGNPMHGKKHTEKTINKISEMVIKNRKYFSGENNCLSKRYVITLPNGEELSVTGIKNFCDNWTSDKLHHSALIKVARNIQSHHKGYKCRYYDEVEDGSVPSFGGHV